MPEMKKVVPELCTITYNSISHRIICTDGPDNTLGDTVCTDVSNLNKSTMKSKLGTAGKQLAGTIIHF